MKIFKNTQAPPKKLGDVLLKQLTAENTKISSHENNI